MKKTLCSVSLLLLSTLPLSANIWPEFRGPSGDGIAQAENLPSEFGPEKNLVWKTALPGRGWSSPVYDGEFLWLTTAKEIFPSEEERLRILESAGEEAKTFKVRQVATRIELSILKVNFESGKIEKEIALESVENPQTIHTLNSFASPTPCLKGKRLFAHFGTFGTYCIDTEKNEVAWRKRIELEHGVGPGSSPVVYDDLLILICDGVDRQFVTALNIDSGETVWTTERPEMRAEKGDQKKSYNTPLIIRNEGGKGSDQLICMGAQWMVSYDPLTGKEIWKFDHGSGFSVVPRPVYSEKHQLLYFSTGFGKPELVAMHIDRTGDVTEGDAVEWRETKRIPAKPSPLLVGDELYVISDGGIATCFNAANGEVYWNERIDGNYSASPLLADGKIFFASQEGNITVVAPGKDYSMIAKNSLDESIMASPIALGESLILRSESAIYRFSK